MAFEERRACLEAGFGDEVDGECGLSSSLEVVGDSTGEDPGRGMVSDRVTVPGYDLHCCVGRGGTSRVYRATRVETGRLRGGATAEFAVKVYSQPIDDEQSRLRFGREVRALLELDHPHIARLFAYGINDRDCPYLVLQYIYGQRLDDYCLSQGLTINERIELLLPICDALQHAHEIGVLHRDLKPGNILVDAGGRPYLTDFGLSKPLQESQAGSQRTSTGAVMGTLNFMASEQLFVGSACVTERTDVFGIGAVMYVLLTGRSPMMFTNFVDAAKWYYHRLPTSLQGGREVPRELEAICLKCLSASPEGRYGSVREVRLELERYLGGDSVSARGSSLTRRLALLAKQYPWLLRSTVATFAATVLVAVVLFALWRQSESSFRRADRASTALKRAMAELSDHVREQAQSPETIQQRRDQLRIISRAFDSLQGDFDRDAELLFDSAQTDFMLARLETYLGDQSRGRSYYRSAERKFRRLVQNVPHHEDAWFGLYHSLQSLAQYREALVPIERLMRDHPENLDYVDAACTSYFALGVDRWSKGKRLEAEPLIGRAIELADRLERHVDRYPRFHRKLAQARTLQAQRMIAAGRLDEAQTKLDQAIEQYEELDVFSSSVVGEACEFLRLLANATSLAAFRDQPSRVGCYKRRAQEVHDRAQRRYPGCVAVHWAYQTVLRECAAYHFSRGAARELKRVEHEVATLLEAWWDAAAVDDMYHQVVLNWEVAGFSATPDLEAAAGSFEYLSKRGDSYAHSLAPRFHLRLGNLDKAADLLRDRERAEDRLWAGLVKRLRTTPGREIVIPELSVSRQRGILSRTLSYAETRIDLSLANDARICRERIDRAGESGSVSGL